MTAEHWERRDLGPYLKYFLYLGVFGFGGPIASVGYMQFVLTREALTSVPPGALGLQVELACCCGGSRSRSRCLSWAARSSVWPSISEVPRAR
jgi:chromate transport protein ChrA